jgi:predicted nuclease of predicted toxin-antitoxin system
VRADLAFYWLDALPVELKGTVTGICRDPKDEPILECAERAEAECIVTGDHDLLSLASYRGIRIIGPRVRRSQISASSRSIAGAHRFPVRSAIDSAVPLSRRPPRRLPD